MAKTEQARLVIPLNEDDKNLAPRLAEAIERLKGHSKWGLVRLTRAALVRMVLDSALDGWLAREFSKEKPEAQR